MRSCTVKGNHGWRPLRFARAQIHGSIRKSILLECRLREPVEGREGYAVLAPAEARKLGKALCQMADEISKKRKEGGR